MSEFLPPVVVELVASIGQFKAKMAEAKSELAGLEAQGAQSFSKFGKAAVVGGAIAGAAAVAMIAVTVKAAVEGEASQARLTTALQNTGQATDAMKAKMEEAANGLAKFGYENDAGNEALAILITSTGDATKATGLLTAAADLAAYKQISLSQAATLVAKASHGSSAALGKMGIDLGITSSSMEKTRKASDALAKAQETYSAMEASGSASSAQLAKARDKVSEAQAVLNDKSSAGAKILEGLNEKLGGQAAAQADTFSGKMASASASMANFSEAIGTVFLPIVSTLAGWLSTLAQKIAENESLAKIIAGVIAGVLLGAIVMVTIGLWNMAAALSAATGGLSLVLPAIVASVVALAGLFAAAYSGSTGFRNAIDKVVGVLKTLWDVIVTNVKPIVMQLFDAFKIVAAYIMEKVVPIISTYLAGAFKFISVVVQGVAKAFELIIDVFKAAVSMSIKIGSTVITVIGGAFTWLMDHLGPVGDFFKKVIAGIQYSFSHLGEIISATWNQIVEGATRGINRVIDVLNGFIVAYNGIAGVLGTETISVLTHVGGAVDEVSAAVDAGAVPYGAWTKATADAAIAAGYVKTAAADAVDPINATGGAASKSADKFKAAKDKIDVFLAALKDVLTTGKDFSAWSTTMQGALSAIGAPVSSASDLIVAGQARAQAAFDALVAQVSSAKRLGNGIAEGFKSTLEEVKSGFQAAFDAAKGAYDAAVADADAFGKSVQAAMLDGFDFKSIFEASDGSFDSFFSGLSEKAGQAAQFANDLKNELIQQLSPEAMQEVIDAGPVTGDAIIQGMIAGGKDAIDKTNELVASTQAAAVKAGESSKDHWKGAGITNAFQQVKGMLGKLQEMTPQIMDVMDEIALKMRRHVVIDVTVSQSAFNVDVYVTRHITEVVDSVSRAVHAAGGWVMGSGTVPILAHAGEFVISNAMLAGRSEMPDSVKAAVGSGGSTTSNNITVNASTNADAYEISHEIAWALKVGV